MGPVPSRSYGQYCAVAQALDAVGDRWTLLVIRELLAGPKRYTDLRDGLPGISTDVLAARLRDLEDSGIVARRLLPPPAASKVYELTEDGQELEPVVVALARWGIGRLSASQDGQFRPEWLAVSLRAVFRADVAADLHATIDFLVGDGRLRARVAGGELTFDREPVGPPDLVIQADPATLATTTGDRTARAAAVAAGRIQIDGDAKLLAAVQQAFAF